MSKTSTEQMRHALNGPTMGTRWTALFHTSPGFSAVDITQALQSAVDEVDNQMSTWKADSDLMRLNAAPVGEWVEIPARLMAVLELGLSIGRASGGAFDIGMGDAVRAWGFGADEAAPDRIRTAHATQRRPAHDLIELAPETLRARKSGPLSLDLNAIAKGYGVDRLAEVLLGYDLSAALVGIDGEMRGLGLRGDTQPWIVAVEDPDPQRRAAHSILGLHNAAVATSGDYRHWVQVGERLLSHTIAVLQILVYAGAIMVLFIFVIMLLNIEQDEKEEIQLKFMKLVGGALAFSTTFGIVTRLRDPDFLAPISAQLVEELKDPTQYGNLQEIGRLLFNRYLLPFELTSILLLVAIIGAVIVAKRDPRVTWLPEGVKQQTARQRHGKTVLDSNDNAAQAEAPTSAGDHH